jgi:hypothetical protein
MVSLPTILLLFEYWGCAEGKTIAELALSR